MSKLYIVPTPVGNLEDMTLRAIRVLKEVDLILAEDTRTSGFLLKHFEIRTPQQSHHKFNEHKTTDHIVQRIQRGETIALISDAGTPAISDPGFLLVRACVEAGLDVECLPGATAFVPALVCSALPADSFTFVGFLPIKKGRQTKIKELSELTTTFILYESPHRVQKTLEQLGEYCTMERQCSVSREISKKFEETRRGTIAELIESVKERPLKGEIVMVVAPADKKTTKTKKYAHSEDE